MKQKILFFLLLIFITITAFHKSESNPFYIPENWEKPVYDFSKNPLSNAKVELGKALFYDGLLSKDNSISCASCHSQYTAFTHVDHALSHGIEDRIGTRNSSSLMNLAWQPIFMWDGAINHLDMQALSPISHVDEMGETIENVIKKIEKEPRYQTAFYEAYGDTEITGERTLKAISQFLLTLVSANSKYDKVKRNEAKFTIQEAKGYEIFKINCSACHQEPLFTNHKFENNGLRIDTTLNDFGRMKITRNPEDAQKFKVPTLRNLEFSHPYMHDGRFRKIREVLNHYTKEIEVTETLSPILKTPIILSDREKIDLTAFLLTLTDKEFLFNQAYSYPRAFFGK
jgi:cytochrome c peroxidase